MKILRISHLGIAPKDVPGAANFFGALLGLQNEGQEVVEDQKVSVDFFKIGESRLELLTPSTPESPIAKFLETKGAGIHHVAVEVDDVAAWVRFLLEKGVKLIDKVPRSGAHNTKIAFVHPHSTGGILVELVEESKSH